MPTLESSLMAPILMVQFLRCDRRDSRVYFFIRSAKLIKLQNFTTNNCRSEETELQVLHLVRTQELLRLASKVNYTGDI